MKRIAVLTSGGDAPGMNAAVSAVVLEAAHQGMEVYGVKDGYLGLIEDRMEPIVPDTVVGSAMNGGTMLGTMRCAQMMTEEGRAKAVETVRRHGIEGVVAIGGDGTFQGAKVLCDRGVPTIGIPGTIDNDLSYTDYTLGFESALATIVHCGMQIRDTMTSHQRVCVMEVMGRHCGDLALYAAAALQAEAVLIPEKPWDFDALCERLTRQRSSGRNTQLVVMSEGLGVGYSTELAKKIMDKTGLDTRASIIGYMQRGGQAAPRDLIMATRMGARAVSLLKDGSAMRVVGIRKQEVIDLDIDEALNVPYTFNQELYETVCGLWD